MCGVVSLCVMHTERRAYGEQTNVSTWYPVLTLSSFLFMVRFIGLLKKKNAPGCRLSISAFFPAPSCCFRQATQDAPEEVRNRDFRRELEERERVTAREKNRDRPTRGKNRDNFV